MAVYVLTTHIHDDGGESEENSPWPSKTLIKVHLSRDHRPFSLRAKMLMSSYKMRVSESTRASKMENTQHIQYTQFREVIELRASNLTHTHRVSS